MGRKKITGLGGGGGGVGGGGGGGGDTYIGKRGVVGGDQAGFGKGLKGYHDPMGVPL